MVNTVKRGNPVVFHGDKNLRHYRNRFEHIQQRIFETIMKTINQRIFEAADGFGITIKSFAADENHTIIHCNRDINVFFKVTVKTDATVEDIQAAMNEMYYRAKGTSHSRF